MLLLMQTTTSSTPPVGFDSHCSWIYCQLWKMCTLSKEMLGVGTVRTVWRPFFWLGAGGWDIPGAGVYQGCYSVQSSDALTNPCSQCSALSEVLIYTELHYNKIHMLSLVYLVHNQANQGNTGNWE